MSRLGLGRSRRAIARAAELAVALAVASGAVVALAASGCGTGVVQVDLDRLAPAVDSADLSFGGEVFADSCSVCHGADGSGGVGAALGGVDARLSARDHVEVVWNGRGTMPPFGGILTEDEIVAVVAYQRSAFKG